MNRQSFVLSALLAAGCAGDITGDPVFSPSDPSAFDESMFDHAAVAHLDPEQRAYVKGHAIGVYLYGKMLPQYVGYTGFWYEPGVSAPAARVQYQWDAIMIATSGGTDGTGVLYSGECEGEDDVCTGPEGDGSDDVDPGTDYPPGTIPPGGGDDGTDYPPGTYPPGGGDDPGSDDPPGTPPGYDPPDGGDDPDGSDDPPATTPPDGGDDPDGTDDPPGDGGDPDDPWIDPDCEEFLDPAALEARWLAREVNIPRMLGGSATTDELAAFEVGMFEALKLEDLGERTDFSEIEHLKEDVQDYGMCEHSPLVLDLDGAGIAVSAAGDGVAFDLLSSGRAVRTAWPTHGALLAMDRDGDGAITHGGELFGNNGRHRDGFAALAELDDNGDGQIDAADASYDLLVVWRDVDRDGVSSPGELTPLADAGVWAIDLAVGPSLGRDDGRNRWGASGSFVRADRTVGTVVDVWFRYRK